MADLKNLYNLLSQKYDAGSYDNFLENLNNQGGMKDVYDKLSGEYEMPDFDSFARRLTDRMQGYGQHSTTPNVNLSQQINNRLDKANKAVEEDSNKHRGDENDYSFLSGMAHEGGLVSNAYKSINGIGESPNLRSTQNLLQQAKDITDKSNYEKGHNVFQKAGYSFKKGFDKNMISNGISNTIDMNNVLIAAMNADKLGYDKLKQSDKDLLDAFAIKSAAEEMNKQGVTQDVAGNIPGQIPYMLQYALTNKFSSIPNELIRKAATTVAKKMLTRGMSKTIGKYIGKIAEKNLITKGMLAKYPELVGKTTVGNVAKTIVNQAERAAIMTPMQPTTYENLLENKVGNAEPTLNGNTIQYGGREGAMDTAKATKEAFLSNFDANMSEMGGEMYAPIVNIAKKSIALKAPFVGGVMDALSKISDSKAAKSFNKATGFQGMIPEYIEEVQNNIMDAVNTNSMSWKDVVNPEQNLETFLTVAATSVGMKALNLGGASMNAMQKRNIRRNYDAAQSDFLNTFGNTKEANTLAQNIANNSPQQNAEMFGRMINSDNYSDKELSSIQNYMLRSTQYGTMIGSVKDKINEAKQKAEKEVRDNANPDMGQLVTVQLDDNDTNGHTVVGGNIAVNEDGTIDAANSDEMITIKDDEGVRKAIDINKIQSVLETKPTEDAVKEATDSAEQQTAEGEASQMEDPTVEIGDTVQVGDRTGMVQARTPEGHPIVQYDDDGTSEVVSPSNIQVIQSNEEEQQQEQQSEEQQKQQSLEELTSTLPKDKDGNIAFDQLNDQQAFQYTSLTDGSETAIADLQNDIAQRSKVADKIKKEIEKSTGGKRIQLREQLKGLQNEINESNQFLQSQQPTQQSNVSQQAVTKQPEQQPIQLQQNEAIPAQAEQVPIQQEQPKQVPTAAKTNNVSQNVAENATIPPNKESKVSKTIPAKVENEKVIKIRERKPRAARYAKEDAALGEPNSLREDLLRNIATGAIKFKWGNSTSGTKGLGAHLGLSTKEMRKYIPFLNNSEGNYPEVAAQKYLENTDYHFGEYTDQDIFNEILDIMQSYNSPRKMMDDAIKMHGDNNLDTTEEEYYKQQEEKYNYEVAEANHMTIEEYNSFLESLQKDLELDSKSDYEISGILADELNEQERLELEEQDEILKQYRDEQNRRTDEVQTGLSEESGKEGSNSEVDRLRTESRNNNERTVETGNVERKNETGRSDNESSGSVSSERVQPYEPTTKEGRDRAKELDGQISNLKSQLEEDRKKYHEAENNFYSANGLFGSSVDEGMFTGTKDTSKENHDQTLKSYKDAIDASKRELDEAVSNRDKLVKTADEEAKRQTEIKPEDDGIRYRTEQNPELEKVNQEFNEELDKQIKGELHESHIYNLGYPSEALQSAGIPNWPIELRSARLDKKANQDNHMFDMNLLKNLPKFVQNPIMVFNSKTDKNAKVILVEITNGDNNFVVILKAQNKFVSGNNVLEINDIRSIYPKDNSKLIDWIIRNNLLAWVNKKKAINWIDIRRSNSAEDAIPNNSLSSATKIINEFQNPTLDEGKIISSIEDLSEKLNTPVRIIRSTDEINDSNDKSRKRKKYGWYDPKTGEVVIVLPNNTSVSDAERTMLHEIVGHKGLRGLLGDKFDAMLDDVYRSLPKDVRTELAKKALENYRGNVRISTEEYLAGLAENDVKPNIVQKIISAIRDFFRNMGIDLKMSNNDITYMLWKSKNRIIEGDTPEIAARKVKADEEIRYRDEIPERDSFDKDVNTLAFRLKENYQDRMLSLKVLIKKVEEITGNVVKDFENALLSENVLTSKSKIENEIFMDKFMVPVFKAVHDLGDIGNTINYMMFKHGLERNEVFAKRDADKWRERAISTLDKTSSDYDNNIKAIDNRYSDILAKNMEKDYSGIKKLEEELGVTAIDYVDSFEKTHDTKNLWNTVNAATKETLRKQYESGMMSKSTYEKVKGMFNYYIPLRGFKEETAEDLYGEMYSSKGKMFSSGMKPAKGRGSIADSPIAYIGQMGAQAIISGNKNLMKQHFLRMCLNHPTKLYSVNPVWIVNIGTKDNPEWKEQAPEYNEDADTYDQNVKDFNERMNNLEAEGMAYKGHPNLKLGMFITKYDADEHEIKVYSNGTPYIIYINANPKVAQAVNGTNNPDANYNGIMKSIMWCNRNMAANFTMRNPAFVLSNFSRDIIYANTRLFVKEGSAYALAFDANYKKSFGALRRFIYGTPDMAKENDRMLQEFLLNGGETGYTASLNVDAYKKITKAEMRKLDGSVDPIKTFRILSRTFANFNRVFEDATRFACYMTSRGEGRSITRSIVDAKEVSVNFNRKGSRQGMLANVIAPMYIFFNAGVQGLDNFLSLFKDYPVKALSAFLAWGALGYLIDMMYSGGGDGDNDYDNLSDWIKWNNGCIHLGGHKFLYIPLSIEVRAFYGMGVILHSWQAGKMKDENVFGKILGRFAEILPIDPSQAFTNWTSLLPSATQPLSQAFLVNKDWTGKPIYKDKDNEYLPNWRKAYAGTSDFAINSAELINSLTGGDFATKGDVDINPAIVEYLFEQYTGGLGKTINESIKTLSSAIHKAANEGEMYWKNAPVINRFFSDSKEYESTGKLNEKYFKMIDFMKGIESRESQYKKGLKNVEFNTEAASKIGKFYGSSDYRRYKVIKLYSTMIGKMKKEEAMANDNQDKQLRRKENELKINMLNKLDEIK